ncbi:MAG: DUF6754 domain-containing protein [Fimbriimonadaceae bacterium]
MRFRWRVLPSPLQTPFFIAACDYVLIGDEFMRHLLTSPASRFLLVRCWAKDWAKILMTAYVMLGFLIMSAERLQPLAVQRIG